MKLAAIVRYSASFRPRCSLRNPIFLYYTPSQLTNWPFMKKPASPSLTMKDTGKEERQA